MDDLWQRHKTFIVECIVGAIVFLVVLGVKSSTYSGVERHQNTAANLDRKLKADPAPSPKSIAEQERNADLARQQIRDLATQVASLKKDKAYVRENLEWAVHNLGLPAVMVDELMTTYLERPQTCLSRLREEARSVLLGRAAQMGKDVDETMGINAAFEDDEVKYGIHGLAMATDLVGRCLALDGVESVDNVAISPRSRRRVGSGGEDGPRAKVFTVRIQFRADPAALLEFIHSLNAQDNHVKRMTVIDRVEYIQREHRDSNIVKVAIDLFGIQYRGIEEGTSQ